MANKTNIPTAGLSDTNVTTEPTSYYCQDIEDCEDKNNSTFKYNAKHCY